MFSGESHKRIPHLNVLHKLIINLLRDLLHHILPRAPNINLDAHKATQ